MTVAGAIARMVFRELAMRALWPGGSQPTPPKEGSQPSAASPSGSAGSGRERAPHAPAAGVPAARHGSVAGATGVGPGAAHSAGRARRHRPAHRRDAVPTQRPGSSCPPRLEPRSAPASRRIRGRRAASFEPDERHRADLLAPRHDGRGATVCCAVRRTATWRCSRFRRGRSSCRPGCGSRPPCRRPRRTPARP
jgi:hypothetical protein